MGRCTEFGVIIKSGCKHKMRAEEASCVCHECGTVCLGQYSGCPDVWDRRDRSLDPVANVDKVDHVADAPSPQPQPEPVPWPAVIRRHVPPPRARAATSAPPPPPPPPPPVPDVEGARDLDAWFQHATAELSARAREIDERADAHNRAFENDRAWLERMLADLPTRARQLDDRAEAHLRALDDDREALRRLTAELTERARQDQPGYDRAELPGLVADAVRAELARSGDPITNINARQRSLEKRIDAVTRRAQEIDERVTARLRTIEDDRTVLADVVRHQDRLAQLIADTDVGERHDRLTEWVHEAIPQVVAAAVDAAMEIQASTMAAAVTRAERVRADMQATAEQNQAAAERMLEALFRRDQEIGGQLQELHDVRAEVAAILEGGRDEIARSVLNSLPALVDVAVRTAMERYATERRSGVTDLSNRLRADADIMREALQRSFEKMMEAIALKEQQLDERAASHAKAIDHDKELVPELWARAARSVTDALPDMVAQAVEKARDEQREAMAALRAEHETTVAELRSAITDLKEAIAHRDEAVKRQAAAHERALAGLRAGLRPAPPTTPPQPEPEPAPEPVLTPADPTNGGRVKLGKSVVPRSQRVERRMLKIDDRDDAAWPALGRREAALTDLLDSPAE